MFSEITAKIKKYALNSSEHKVRRNRAIYDVFRRMIHPKARVSAITTAAFMLAVTVTYASPQYFDVKIVDGDNSMFISASAATVEEILEKSGVDVSEYDIVYPERSAYITSSGTVVIRRVKTVNLTIAGENKVYRTAADTVKDFFDEKGIVVNYHDIVSSPMDTVLGNETDLSIIRVIKRIEKTETPVAFNTKTIQDTSMSISDSKVTTKGVEGIDCQTYEVLLYDGAEVSRNLISTERLREPVDEVKVVGTKGQAVTAKGDNFSYSKVITCNATAYDLSFQSCGKMPGQAGYGVTASGTRAHYGTVAVDPRVIPLGTRMYIESADGSFVYGYCVAEDTGGAIKGNKVDLFFNTYGECMQFGRRNVKVYILD